MATYVMIDGHRYELSDELQMAEDVAMRVIRGDKNQRLPIVIDESHRAELHVNPDRVTAWAVYSDR